MATEETFLTFHGLRLPKETHDLESLKFAHDFTFKDNDVLAVTYPKSGQLLFRLKHVATCCISKNKSKHCDTVLSYRQKVNVGIAAWISLPVFLQLNLYLH